MTTPIVLSAFRETTAVHGVPVAVLTDDGIVFTTRLSGRRDGGNHLEHELRQHAILQ